MPWGGRKNHTGQWRDQDYREGKGRGWEEQDTQKCQPNKKVPALVLMTSHSRMSFSMCKWSQPVNICQQTQTLPYQIAARGPNAAQKKQHQNGPVCDQSKTNQTFLQTTNTVCYTLCSLATCNPQHVSHQLYCVPSHYFNLKYLFISTQPPGSK